MVPLLTSRRRHHIERNWYLYTLAVGAIVGLSAVVPLGFQIPMLAIAAIALYTLVDSLMGQIHDARIERDVAIAREEYLRRENGG